MSAKCTALRLTLLLLSTAVIVSGGLAQSPPPAANTLPGSGSESLTDAQVDQLTAPIALYSDPLLGAVLAASTYPLEVVEATRWLENPQNAALSGEALSNALTSQSWDASVKFLVSFPQVLRMMNDNLEWTERIGDAFLDQQSAVMDSVQRLRRRAAANGSLTSTPQQTVATQDNDVSVAPTNPDVLYVPCYAPATVYGPWPYPDYPPYYFPLAPGVVCNGITFSVGVDLFEPWWGWYGWNWPYYGFLVFPQRPHPGKPPVPRPWQHDPAHRHGVPYSNPSTAARFLGAAAGRQQYRGFPQVPAGESAQALGATTGHLGQTPEFSPRAVPPAFESLERGPQVRSDSARGFSSRMSAPSFHGGGHR